MGESGKGNVANLRPFQPGQSGNPAGARKSGRTLALQLLDEILTSAPNQHTLKKAMQEAFDKNPMRFFESIVMPLLPKAVVGELDLGDRVVQWKSLLGVCQTVKEQEASGMQFPDMGGGV